MFSRVGLSGKRVSKVKQGDSETAKVHASVNKSWGLTNQHATCYSLEGHH